MPAGAKTNYDYSAIEGVFTDYWKFERKDIFDISQKLQDLSKEIPPVKILESIQNYILTVLKSNPRETKFIEDIRRIEECKKQAKLGIKPVNIFDDLCLKLIL